MTKRIGYLGPPGTFTEQAALLYDPQAKLLPFPSVPAVGMAVSSGMADEGVAAIENSLDGSVPDTLDLLIQDSRLLIKRELVLPISQCLLVKKGTAIDTVQVIFSHPQAIGQCRKFVERCFPKAQLVAALSTTSAVEEMKASQTTAAAIAPQRAAEIYGVEVAARGIQDNAANTTRFVVLALEDHKPTGQDKTSIAFSFSEDKPGQLYSVLGEFATRGINLAKVESRPTKSGLGSYIFLIDLEGHREEKLVHEVLSRVRAETSMLKVLGSYPKYKAPAS